MNGRQRPVWYFVYAQDDLNLRILRMFEGVFALRGPGISAIGSGLFHHNGNYLYGIGIALLCNYLQRTVVTFVTSDKVSLGL